MALFIAFCLISSHICERSNLFTTFVLMLIIIILSFIEWRHGWSMFCACEDELFTCTADRLYTFYSFLALNSSHICEPSNLFTTFVLMLIIILSFVKWRHGWSTLCACEDELFTCTAECTLNFHSILSLNSLHICEPSNLWIQLAQ